MNEKVTYIEVVSGEHKGARGYIMRVHNRISKPNQCVIYVDNEPISKMFNHDEIKPIIPKIPRLDS